MPRVAIFDAYGTLLDVDAAMRAHAGRLGPDWQRISQDWRIKRGSVAELRDLTDPPLADAQRLGWVRGDAFG